MVHGLLLDPHKESFIVSGGQAVHAASAATASATATLMQSPRPDDIASMVREREARVWSWYECFSGNVS